MTPDGFDIAFIDIDGGRIEATLCSKWYAAKDSTPEGFPGPQDIAAARQEIAEELQPDWEIAGFTVAEDGSVNSFWYRMEPETKLPMYEVEVSKDVPTLADTVEKKNLGRKKTWLEIFLAEHLHDMPRVKAKTLFATHYHELADLALTLGGVVNCSVLVREREDGIVFLRRIVEGAADKSYGIAVAQPADMPEPVLKRVRQILANLEADEIAASGRPALVEPHVSEPSRRRRPASSQARQPTLFDL